MGRAKPNKPRRQRPVGIEVPSFWLPPEGRELPAQLGPLMCWHNAVAACREDRTLSYAEGVAARWANPDGEMLAERDAGGLFSWVQHGWCMRDGQVVEATWDVPGLVYVGDVYTAADQSRTAEETERLILAGRTELQGHGYNPERTLELLGMMRSAGPHSLQIAQAVASGRGRITTTRRGEFAFEAQPD